MMMPDSWVLLTTILLLFPMGYLFLACPAFLLVRLSIPVVPRLLRAMFKGYFLMLMAASPVAALAYAATGRIGPALGLCLIVAYAAFGYRWFLRSMDLALQARDAGDTRGVKRLRSLHWMGMLANALQLGAILTGLPKII